MQGEKNKVKKKILRLVVIHLSAAVLIVLGIFKYAEELQMLKERLYYAVVASEDVQEETLERDSNAWYMQESLIYHAGGGYEGASYTNANEAILHTLENNNYLIEMDFLFTSDRQLVCAHSWDMMYPDGYVPSAEEFLSERIQGKYTPITAAELIQIMRDYPQMHLVIDTKEENLYLVVAELVSLAGEDPGVIDRFVIQLYAGTEKAGLKAFYPFREEQFLLSLYKIGNWDQSVLRLCEQEGIYILTTFFGQIPDEDVSMLRERGFILFEHTVNDPEQVRTALNRGICGVYTDFLTSEMLETLP